MEEFYQAQDPLIIPDTNMSVTAWHRPPKLVFKSNFDAAIFSDLNNLRFGAMILDEKGEVMAVMSTKGPPVGDSKEAEIILSKL